MEGRLRQALQRAEEVGKALADPLVARDPSKLKALGREHTRLAIEQNRGTYLSDLPMRWREWNCIVSPAGTISAPEPEQRVDAPTTTLLSAPVPTWDSFR